MDTGGSKDLISSLPDALICHILSFLSTKDAALTSVLSTRWRFLFAFVPNLDLDNSIINHQFGRLEKIRMSESFRVFVDRVMALQENAPLNKLSLRCEFFLTDDTSHVNGWILNVLERGVVELDLDFSSLYKYQLPPKVLMSKTLVRLKLAGTSEFYIDVREVFLPKLKVLHLNYVVFKFDFAKLISGCHALEELVMINVFVYEKSSSVSNPNLKRVTIYYEKEPMIPKTVFEASNLVYLEFSATIAAEFPKGIFDSLVEASLSLRSACDAVETGSDYSLNMTGNVADFLMGISNVKILYLSLDTLEVLAFYCCKEIPVFNNLLHLTIETGAEVEWKAMPNLLENCPNLETLVFQGLHYKDTNQCEDMAYRFKDAKKCVEDRCVCKPWDGIPIWLSSSSVKILKVFKFGEITCYSDNMDKQVEMIKYLVESMPKLEEVILYYDTANEDVLRRLSTGYQKLEKVASANCKMQVISDIINFSSTVYLSSSSISGLVIDGQNNGC